jgi:hypothetical protein
MVRLLPPPVERKLPELVIVELLTLRVVSLEVPRITPVLIVVAALVVVVVTGPPFICSRALPAPADLAKVRVRPEVGVKLTAPLAVLMVAVELSGAVTVRLLAPPPESKLIVEAPVALRTAPAENDVDGELIFRFPDLSVCVKDPKEIEAPVLWAFRFSVPEPAK